MVFKILDARQSEIHVQFTRNISFTLCKNFRKLFRKLKRFQILLWAWSRGNRRAFLTYFCRSPCHRRIVKSLAFASRNCSVTPEVEGHSSAESTNFTLFVTHRNVSRGYLLRLQTLYNFTHKLSRLSRCRERFSWKYRWVKILKNMLNASSENLSTTIRWWGFVDNFCGYSSGVDSVCLTAG